MNSRNMVEVSVRQNYCTNVFFSIFQRRYVWNNKIYSWSCLFRKLNAHIDYDIQTPAGHTSDRVQELHIKVIHILIELVERVAFGIGK